MSVRGQSGETPLTYPLMDAVPARGNAGTVGETVNE